jgi:hypothetical protein
LLTQQLLTKTRQSYWMNPMTNRFLLVSAAVVPIDVPLEQQFNAYQCSGGRMLRRKCEHGTVLFSLAGCWNQKMMGLIFGFDIFNVIGGTSISVIKVQRTACFL